MEFIIQDHISYLKIMNYIKIILIIKVPFIIFYQNYWEFNRLGNITVNNYTFFNFNDFFLFSVVFIVNKYCKTFYSKISMILISISILFTQSSNSSIAFFQEGLLIASLLPLFTNKYKLENVIFSIIFFSLSFFTRIDSLIFMPLSLIYLIRASKNKKSNIKLLIFFLYLTIPLIIYIIFSIYFQYSFQDFTHI